MPEKTNNADNRIKQLFSGFSYACDTNENNLRRILRDNKDTEFGRRFGFADISSAEEFSKKYFNGKHKTGSYGCLKK